MAEHLSEISKIVEICKDLEEKDKIDELRFGGANFMIVACLGSCQSSAEAFWEPKNPPKIQNWCSENHLNHEIASPFPSQIPMVPTR